MNYVVVGKWVICPRCKVEFDLEKTQVWWEEILESGMEAKTKKTTLGLIRLESTSNGIHYICGVCSFEWDEKFPSINMPTVRVGPLTDPSKTITATQSRFGDIIFHEDVIQ